jgi:hypothetical protein
MRFVEYTLMTISAENIDWFFEQLGAPSGMSSMTLHAITVLNRGMDYWHYEIGLPVAAKAEGRD